MLLKNALIIRMKRGIVERNTDSVDEVDGVDEVDNGVWTRHEQCPNQFIFWEL